MRLVIFGAGEIYSQNRSRLDENDKIVAFLDNNSLLQGTEKEGISVYAPQEIEQLSYDCILIMSNYAVEMRDQLIELGCERGRILHYLEYFSRQGLGRAELFFGRQKGGRHPEYLIIVNWLDYTGAPMTAVYAALALQSRGHGVVVAASGGDGRFIEEFRQKGICFLLYPNLQYAKWDELFWLEDFSKVLVVTYPMMLCAMEIARHRKVSVWLHESDCVYSYMEFWKDVIKEGLPDPDVDIYAVGKVARENFIRNVKDCSIKLLSYGIPDVREAHPWEKKEGLTFAVVGTISPVKQQHLFLEAVGKLDEVYNRAGRFLLVGDFDEYDTDYARKIREKADTMENVFCLGKMIRRELNAFYQEVDVLVVTAMQETMSLVATEAMMLGKPCIVCDVAGMAEFIRNGENGFVYETGNSEELAKQMNFCFEHKDALRAIGEKARSTYIQFFTMEDFGKRLERV